jgi:multidrug efflux pump subunit AcrA (membrane-fusion protein)
VAALVPQGDVATRTFPLRILLPSAPNLAQGMEARAILANGPVSETLLVPRDAVASAFGQQAVWTVQEGKAVMLPAVVVGFQGDMAGVRAEGLTAGMPVVVKGNERLRPGQPVAPEPAKSAGK